MKPLSKQTLILILLGLLAIVAVGLFVIEKKEEMPVVKTPPTPIEKDMENEEKETFSKYNKVLDRAKITGVEDLEGEYKKVTINNGEITFSFEVPDHWLTETRNSGEVEMNEEELREFMATRCIYDQETKDMYFEKEPSFSLNELSDYFGVPQNTFRKLSLQEVYSVYFDKQFPLGGVPMASVSLGCMVYYGPNGSQTDFYILSPDEAEYYYDYDQRTQSIDDSKLDKGVLENIRISNRNGSSFYANNTDISGLAGSKTVFIPLQNKVLMVYVRNLDYNDEVKQGFQHILDSLSIQNPLP